METKQLLIELLDAIWKGIPGDFKSKYRLTVWTQFENEIKSAAYTNSFARFLSRLCVRLQVEFIKKDLDAAMVEPADIRAAMRMLRYETTVLVLHVRLRNQDRQEEYKEKQAKKNALIEEQKEFERQAELLDQTTEEEK